MTRYRLPEVLGGGEYDGEPIGGKDANVIRFAILDIGVLDIAAEVLTKVEPPEPTGECIVQVGMRFFHHRDGRAGSIGWYDLEHQTWETWKRLCRLGQPYIYRLVEELPEWERELLEGQAR
jgi:hypothetical protein